MKLRRYFPILDWGACYNRETLVNDGLAAIIVTIMLIPQSLAYAMLAGLPPQIGLYASILPLIAYAIFGTSRTLAVGPVAVISLLTAATASKFAPQGGEYYLTIAITLALLSGIMLLILGCLRAGFLANFLSHPVISGFITASGLIIALSQFKHIFGIKAHGHNLIDLTQSIIAHLPQTNIPTLLVGGLTVIFLFLCRLYAVSNLQRMGLSEKQSNLLARLAPVIAVIVTIIMVATLGLNHKGVSIIGDVPSGIPPLAIPQFDYALWSSLAGSAMIISVIGFVESISVAQTFAAKRRQRIDPDQELIGLGASNIMAAFSGGYPVTGGFSRSAVNFEAGAETPAAGAFTAIGIGLATVFLTPALYYLPKATLAATIIVAIVGLLDFGEIKRAWHYSKTDFAAIIITITITLIKGVELGVLSGVAVSIALFLYKSSRPHYAIVGQIADTEHFRNIERHRTITVPGVITIRVDESLYFANARYLEDIIYHRTLSNPNTAHVILMCPAVNDIDLSALESLENINNRLKLMGVLLHMSEVKGPVMDKLKRSRFLHNLTGQVFLSQYKAIESLCGNSYGTDLEYNL